MRLADRGRVVFVVRVFLPPVWANAVKGVVPVRLSDVCVRLSAFRTGSGYPSVWSSLHGFDNGCALRLLSLLAVVWSGCTENSAAL